MHKMAVFNKEKYLLASTLSTSLSILLLLLKLNLVNMYKTVNQKYNIMILLQEAILLEILLWPDTEELEWGKFSYNCINLILI